MSAKPPFALLLTFLTGTTLPTPLRSQQEAPAEPAAAAEVPGGIEIGRNGFVLPTGNVGARDLVEAAARYLARNILWTEAEFANVDDFTFQRRLAVDARGCEELLGSLLATRGIVIVPIDAKRQLYEVVNLRGARGGEAALRAVAVDPEEVLARPDLQRIVLCALPLEHINANIATNALRPFMAQNVGHGSPMQLTLGTAGTEEALLLRGFTDQVAACIRIVRECDRPLAERNPQLHQWQQTVNNLTNQVATLQNQVANLQQRLDSMARPASAGTADRPDDPADPAGPQGPGKRSGDDR